MAGGRLAHARTVHSMSRPGISWVTVQHTVYSAMSGMSPRGRRSMSMSDVWPTAVSGAASGAAWSIPEPSMSSWRAGSERRRKIAWAGAAMRRVTVTRSADAGSAAGPLMGEARRSGGVPGRWL